ncbi:MAG TPA: hypothetical protein VN737_05355 [Bryobacteraceae bacterium]|nr:hypothetical protein [Bryobacteraceae bacterium]
MTTATETKETNAKKPAKPADFYLFEQVQGSKENKIVGRAYKHGKGNGMNILLNGKRYSLFPAKPKTEAATEGKSA